MLGLSRVGRGVVRIGRPFRMPNGLGGSLPVRTLDREVDVGVGVGLPAFALEHPARLATAAGVAAARDGVAECSILAVFPYWILWVLRQVADALEPLLVAELDAAEIQHRFLHGHEHPLALTCLLTLHEGGEDADQEVHAGVAVAERGAGDRRRAVPETRRRGVAAGALRHVFVRLDVGEGRAIGEAFDDAEDQARVELMDMFPGEALAVERARRHVFDHHIGAADQLLQDRLAFGRLGVDLETTACCC